MELWKLSVLERLELARGIEPPTCGLYIAQDPSSTTSPLSSEARESHDEWRRLGGFGKLRAVSRLERKKAGTVTFLVTLAPSPNRGALVMWAGT